MVKEISESENCQFETNKKIIEVNNLVYTYPGKEEKTLKNLNFSINQGEIFGFLGPSGAGKSTTQKIISGILKNFQGEVRVMGHDIKRIDNDFYEDIGVSFEFPNLYERFTGMENLPVICWKPGGVILLEFFLLSGYLRLLKLYILKT
ncbi:MAG: ATP-binding cassette domain-containing protein [Nanoarchaeota archaeon]